MKRRKKLKISRPRKALALSVRQPWAWLIVNGHKDIENRSWDFPPEMKGKKIFIHSGRTPMSEEDFREFKRICRESKIKAAPRSPTEFIYGAIIGTVVLERVVENSKSPWAEPGLYHWVLRDSQVLEPRLQKGQLGFFEVE